MSHAANFWKNLLWALFIAVYNPQSLTHMMHVQTFKLGVVIQNPACK
jgi:hypothetical protein